jgi:drug/metabolite transporter (DMT)-like permease
LTIAVIIYFSIDFKTFKVPKTFGLILLVQWLISARYLLMSRVILELGDRVFFVYDIVLYTLALVVIIWFNHQWGQIRAFPASFYKFRFWAAFTGVIGTVISLYLIAELWATVVLLLGFLQVALIMIMATLYLGEHPTRRDILMTIIVTALVWIGFYFK